MIGSVLMGSMKLLTPESRGYSINLSFIAALWTLDEVLAIFPRNFPLY